MFDSTSSLLAALTYPRAPGDFLEVLSPGFSRTEIRARVVAARRETDDVATLVLRPNGRWRGHVAGQHVLLTAEIGGVRRTRCFSIASAPDRRAPELEITVKARPSGAVTPALVAGAALGALVTLSPARGDFVLPDPLPRRILFVSGGSGITPVMSMLRSLLLRDHTGDVTFVHYARSEADVIFRDELARIARGARPNIRVHVRTGAFSAVALAEMVPDFERRATWACGPEPMLALVQRAFADRGAADRLHVERFSLASTAPSAGSDPDDGEVHFTRSGARAKGSAPLLVLAERAGLTPASGCRMGICQTCRCRKVSGATRDLRTGEVSTDADVEIQLCVNVPVGPVEIDM